MNQRAAGARHRLHDQGSGEEGFALILVMGIGVVLLGIAFGVLAVAVSSMKTARHSQDYNGALSAADAGVDDYIYRLNADSSYNLYSTVPNTCTGTAVAANPDPANPAMSGWRQVPGGNVADLKSQPQFRYTVDISQYCSAGKIVLTSSGRVGTTVRTVRSIVKRKGFLDFIYFTDHEDQDPALYTTNPFLTAYTAPDNTPDAVCGRHYYDKSSDGNLAAPRPDAISANPGCSVINFGGGDRIQGPMHSNDAPLICGSVTFNGPAFTSWGYTSVAGANPTTAQHWRANPGCSNSPDFDYNDDNICSQAGAAIPAVGGSNDFCVEAPLTMPASNASLISQTDARITSTPGCIFTGPTKITFKSNGTMDVLSPDTYLNETAHPSNCALSSQNATTNRALPSNGVIYVQAVPAGYSSQACTTTNGIGFDADGTPYKTTIAGASASVVHPDYVNPVGYPQGTNGIAADAEPPEWTSDASPYPCTAGDVFVAGTLKGRATIGADRNIYIVDDLKYNGGESTAASNTDLLGLIANRYVEIYHPVACPSYTGVRTGSFDIGECTTTDLSDWTNLPVGTSTTFDNPQVDAAILSVQHSFRVQGYDHGPALGTLNVFGALAQEYRGIVGVIGSTGYVKGYVYDTRLKFQSPPSFITPVQAPYQVASYSEEKHAY